MYCALNAVFRLGVLICSECSPRQIASVYFISIWYDLNLKYGVELLKFGTPSQWRSQELPKGRGFNDLFFAHI